MARFSDDVNVYIISFHTMYFRMMQPLLLEQDFTSDLMGSGTTVWQCYIVSPNESLTMELEPFPEPFTPYEHLVASAQSIGGTCLA